MKKIVLLLTFSFLIHAMQQNEVALFSAASNGNLSYIKWLFETQSYKNPRNKKKETALHKAVARGHNHVARYLIEDQGYDPNDENNQGETALHYAAARNNTSLVDYLLRKEKVNIRKKSQLGTAAQIAKRFRAGKVMKVIIKHVGKRAKKDNNKNGGFCPVCLDHVPQRLYNVSNYECLHFICGECKRSILSKAFINNIHDGCALCRMPMSS